MLNRRGVSRVVLFISVLLVILLGAGLSYAGSKIEEGRKINPDTLMPPFGANKILTEEQIDAVVDYLYSLKGGK